MLILALLIASFLPGLQSHVSGQTAATEPSGETNRLSVSVDQTGGLQITYDGVPVIRGSLLQIFAINSRDSFSSGRGGRVLPFSESGTNQHVIVYDHPHSIFQGRVACKVTDKDSVTLTMDGLWKQPEAARFEWAAGRLWSQGLEDAEWIAEESSGSVKQGKLAPNPTSDDWRSAILAQGFRTFQFRGRAYHLTISAGNDSPDILVFDGRRSRANWAQGGRYLWLGFVDSPVPSHMPFKRSLTLKFTPIPFAAGETVQYTTPLVPLPKHPPRDTKPPVIIPAPKQAAFSRVHFTLTPQTKVYCQLPNDRRIQRAVTQFRSDFGNLPRATGKWTGKGILIAVPSGATRTDHWLTARALSVYHDDKPGWRELYQIRVTRNYIVVLGRTAAGAFYGLQTLRQLAKRTNTGIEFHGAEILDWPSLTFRGAHLFVGNRARPYHQKLISRIFSRYKLNHLVLQCEYVRWDTDPSIAVDFSMSKKDLIADVEYARTHFMEVSPLINSLGHAEWMFKNGRNLDLAEDPVTPYAVRVRKPETHAFLRSIIDEALEIFKPNWFHIGHDEVSLFGRYPFRPESISAGSTLQEAETNLFLENVHRLHSHLQGRSVKTMLWGDMLLNRSESSDMAANAPTPEIARQRREGLPFDVVIADWHYSPEPKERYKSLQVFQSHGFPVIATTWYNPENIYHFARAAIEQKALGLLQSTWAGYNSHEGVLKTEMRQFVAFILAAEYAWSGNPLPPDRLPYRAEQIFKELWRDPILIAGQTRYWSVDLQKVSRNLPLSAFNLPTGMQWFGAIPFIIAGRSNQPKGITLSGRLLSTDPKRVPKSISLSIGKRAKWLFFLHASAYPSTNRETGSYTILYSDGRRKTVPLIYGDHIRALFDPGEVISADNSWIGKCREGQSAAIQTLRWKNPFPSVPIRAIEFHSSDSVASPILLAITGYE
jgi:hypothetical protein